MAPDPPLKTPTRPYHILGHALGCRPDPKDPRDLRITRMTATQAKDLPAKFDHTPHMSPVEDQGDEGTCVGFACADGMKEYQEHREHDWDVQMSSRHVYEGARMIEPMDPPEEEGATIRAAMKHLHKKGVCEEMDWPYVPGRKGEPKEGYEERALKYRIERYARITSLEEMKESLVANGPFVAGVMVFTTWNLVDRGGIVIEPDIQRDHYLGGHAICIVGYDDSKELFRFKNSWGKRWGNKGYGYLTYRYMRKYTVDAWSARDLIAGTGKD